MAVTRESGLGLEKVVAIIGIASALLGVASTWTLLQYRIAALEEQSKHLQSEVEQTKAEMHRMEEDFNAQGERLKCMICAAQSMRCPGC